MKIIVTILFGFISITSYSQDLTQKQFENRNDSLSVFKFRREKPIPKKAAMYSAIFPGIGQIYNRQYWKLAIVGAGLGTAGYFIHFNNREYKRFRKAYIQRIDGDSTTIDEFDVLGGLSTQSLNDEQNRYRQYLEYSVIFTTVGYAINVLDAYVAGHLKSFDINDNITMRTKPTFENNQLGLALVFKIK